MWPECWIETGTGPHVRLNEMLGAMARGVVMDIVKMAQQVLDMNDELQSLRDENARLRKYEQLYREELRTGVAHGEKMMAATLGLLMTPGVVDACRSQHHDA